MSIDETRLEELMETAIADVGAANYAPLAVLGDRLGLYDALAEAGPLTASELADRTDTAERYVREWLATSAASDYVTYDPDSDRYDLSPEQALLLSDTVGPAPSLTGMFQMSVGAGRSLQDLETAFHTGEGVGWHEHDEAVFEGMSRSSELGYEQNLVTEWIPALEGVDENLSDGGRVADIGCGYGATTIKMARAYPKSTFVGYDYHEESIKAARERAASAGLDDRVSFEVAWAKDYDGAEYDLVTMFDCLHDLGDPVGVADHVRETLAEDGTWMIAEFISGDEIAENLNPLGRMMYSFSTMLCTPNALDQEGHHALGNQPGPERLREVVIDGGFSTCRVATETPPFNMVLEAKP